MRWEGPLGFKGKYKIQELKPGDKFKIPAGTPHSLAFKGMEMGYFTSVIDDEFKKRGCCFMNTVEKFTTLEYSDFTHNFRDKTILITGASRGLGLEYTR